MSEDLLTRQRTALHATINAAIGPILVPALVTLQVTKTMLDGDAEKPRELEPYERAKVEGAQRKIAEAIAAANEASEALARVAVAVMVAREGALEELPEDFRQAIREGFDRAKRSMAEAAKANARAEAVRAMGGDGRLVLPT